MLARKLSSVTKAIMLEQKGAAGIKPPATQAGETIVPTMYDKFVADFKTILFDPMDTNKDGVVSLTELREYYLKIQVKTEEDLTEEDEQMFADFFAQRDEDGDGEISWPEMWRAERTRHGSLVQTVLKTQQQREEREEVIEEARLRRQSAKTALKMGVQERPEKEKEIMKERAKQAFLQKRIRWQAWDEFDAFEDEDALKKIFNKHIETPQQLDNLMYCVYMNLFNIEGAMKSEKIGLLHRCQV